MKLSCVNRRQSGLSRGTRRRRSLVGLALLAAGLAGCGNHRASEIQEERAGLRDDRITGEAFAFDARLRRDGKPSTFQLEVYKFDSLLGFSGKGYLGKGGLKGRLTDDSLIVCFPTSNEYLAEPLDSLFRTSTCPLPVADLSFLRLFDSRPDSLVLPGAIAVEVESGGGERPAFVLTGRDCHWSLRLTYDRQASGWRIREFHFDDGESVSLKGSRTRYRFRAEIRTKRFEATLPSDAVRIQP